MLQRIASMLLVLALGLAVVGCDGIYDDEAVDPEGIDVGAPTTPAAVDPATLLTPGDVEAVSDLRGLEVVPYDPAVGAGGNVNIADASGQLVAMLVVEGPETWAAWVTDGFTVSTPIDPPVGDESFMGPNPDVSPVVYIFGFRKGDVAIVIDTFFDANGETILSVEQLRELAEIVEGRL